MATPNRPSLLGLPLDLRLHIYDHVCLVDINLDAGEHIDLFHAHVEGGTHARGHHLPWLELTLTCRTIGDEIRRHVGSFGLLADEDKRRTCELDLVCAKSGSRLSRATWRRLPCTPLQARRLMANIEKSEHPIRLWGDGGPSPLTGSLYQTLNRFIHCGPLLKAGRPLHRHAQLHGLIVNIEVTEEGFPVEFGFLAGLISRIVSTGVLYAYVDTITVIAGSRTRSWMVEWKEHGGIPSEWLEYDFEWGIMN